MLRDARSKAGLRQVDLAKRLGLPQSYVSKYESGERRLDLLDLQDVCVAIGISLVGFLQTFEDACRQPSPSEQPSPKEGRQA